ncbi:MAG: hypothetical protein ACM33B_03705 [Pseudomonadota bacterium]
MRLVDQWRAIEAELPERWGEATLSLTLADEARQPRAAALLAPLAPGRSGTSLRFSAVRHRAGASSGAVARALARLDAERIRGEVGLVATDEAAVAVAAPQSTAAGSWDGQLATLPSDWSDVWGEVRLRNTDVLERAALLCAPLNPARTEDGFGFRFRAARVSGYGASTEMVRRCLSRLDEEGIPARASVLRALSDTGHVSTQGPVWYVDGKVV